MLTLYEKDKECLEWILKVYNELSVEDNQTIHLHIDVNKYCNMLLECDKDSSMSIFTKAILLFNINNILDARDCLINGKYKTTYFLTVL